MRLGSIFVPALLHTYPASTIAYLLSGAFPILCHEHQEGLLRPTHFLPHAGWGRRGGERDEKGSDVGGRQAEREVGDKLPEGQQEHLAVFISS